MIYLDETCWNEAMLRGLLEDMSQASLAIVTLRLQIAQQAAEVVRGKIDVNHLMQRMQQLTKENEALRELSVIDRQRAGESASHERHWRAEVTQLKYKIEALEKDGHLLPIDRKNEK